KLRELLKVCGLCLSLVMLVMTSACAAPNNGQSVDFSQGEGVVASTSPMPFVTTTPAESVAPTVEVTPTEAEEVYVPLEVSGEPERVSPWRMVDGPGEKKGPEGMPLPHYAILETF